MQILNMDEYINLLSLYSVPTGLAIVVFLFVFYLCSRRNRKKHLSGPWGVPFLGYYPFLKDEYHLQLREMSKKYGDVFTFSVTGQPYVHINSLKVLREAFVSKADCFSCRGDRYSILRHCYYKGMSFEQGEPWKILRRFYVQTLKEFGMTSLKGNLAGPFYNALKGVSKEIRDLKGDPFNSVELMTKYCTSILQELLFRGVDVEKKDLEDLNKAYWDMLSAMRGTRLLLSGPIAKYFILPYASDYRAMAKGRTVMDTILMKIIRDHESSLDEDNPRDFVDHYIIERNLRTRKEDPTAQYFTNESLSASLIQFLGDGSLTNGYLVSAFLNVLVQRPEVQEKIHSEILEVIGSDREPLLEDKTRMPYTNAAILEILRTLDFAPIFPSLVCTKETTLNGYTIPEGCMTVINFYSILRNPEIYKNPEVFDPERFIDTPEKPKEEFPVAFGVGKRSCAGESLIMMEVFLFMLTIVRNFKLISPPEKEGDEKVSFQVADIAIQICAQARSEE